MNCQQGELKQLKLSDMLLPPERILHFRSVGCEEVVSVHDDMNEAVYKS